MTTRNNDAAHKSGVGVVIPCYNGRQYIQSCLQSLQESDSSGLVIVVVDNASTDGSVDYIENEFPEVTLLRQKQNIGFAAACNRGFNELIKRRVKYIMLLNQDTVVERGWEKPLVQCLESNSSVMAVQSLLERGDGQTVNSVGNRIHFLGFGYSEGDGRSLADTRVQRHLKQPMEIDYASGAAMMMRIEDTERLGLFQENFFMYHEDLDLGWRIRLTGGQSMLVPASRVRHLYDFHRSSKIKYEFGERNRLIVILENYHAMTILLIMPAWIFMEVGILAMSFINGWSVEKMRGYYYIFNHLPDILKRRRICQAARLSSERKVVSGFSGAIYYQENPSPLLKIVNPVFRLYWRLARFLILW